MIGGRDSDDEEPSDSRTARILMVAVLALAVAATAVLVLSDSARWLRLGVLAALWAALLGVFLASRFRKSMTERESEVADLQSVYELELEREMAARREFEQEVEAAARQKVESANREDLAELKAELRSLRENLERLTGGEVLVERFALRAQSTRMRSLAEGQPRVVASAEDSARLRRGIAAAADATELIPRPDPSAVRRPQQRTAAYRPEPSRPQTPRDPSTPGEAPERREQAAAQPTRVARPVQPRQVSRTARVPEPQQQGWPSQAAAADVLHPQRPAAQRPTQAPQPQRRSQPATHQSGPHPIPSHPTGSPATAPPTPGDVGLSARLDGRTPSQAPAPEPAAGRRGAAAYEQTQRAEPVERSRHAADPAPEPGGQRHAQPDAPPQDWQEFEADPETTGAHAAGKSVTELLAAHGTSEEDSHRRHRRRAD